VVVSRSDLSGDDADLTRGDSVPRGLSIAPDGGSADSLRAMYDPATLAAIDAAVVRRRGQAQPVGPPPRRGGTRAVSLAGALWLGALTGVGEALTDEDRQSHKVWFVPVATDPEAEAVSIHLVPGVPAASHVVVRTWLLAGH
jgi:hypothetical protein